MDEMNQSQDSGSTNNEDEAKKWACISYLSAFLGCIIPFGNIIGPIIIWKLKGSIDSFVELQAKQVVNFQISMLVIALVLGILAFIMPMLSMVFGLGVFVVAIFTIVITVIGAIKVSDGVNYQVPWKYDFL